MKAYVLVREDIPTGRAINSAAHAGVLIEKHFPQENDPIMQEWLEKFNKVTCKVTDKEFAKAKTYQDWFVVSEDKLNDEEILLFFKPREEWPRFFSFLKLYK